MSREMDDTHFKMGELERLVDEFIEGRGIMRIPTTLVTSDRQTVIFRVPRATSTLIDEFRREVEDRGFRLAYWEVKSSALLDGLGENVDIYMVVDLAPEEGDSK